MFEKPFAAIGAKLEVEEARRQIWRNRKLRDNGPLPELITVNVEDKTFKVRQGENWDLQVLNVDAADRHLVLLAKNGRDKRRFLCGHDERDYFVAAIPEHTPVTTVRDAKLALMPDSVRDKPLKRKERGRRKTSAFIRQGEWFFVPTDFDPGDAPIYRNEPIARTGGKPHRVEELCRIGGVLVYVNATYAPNGIPQRRYNELLKRNPGAVASGWRTMMLGATAYARGKVSHSDHATIKLDGWHRIDMNTENRALAMQSVAFLD